MHPHPAEPRRTAICRRSAALATTPGAQGRESSPLGRAPPQRFAQIVSAHEDGRRQRDACSAA